MDKILLLQVEEDKFYDKDGNDYWNPPGDNQLQCSLCNNNTDTPFYMTIKTNDCIICSNCVTILQLKEVLTAQLFKIKLEKQRKSNHEAETKRRPERELAKLENTACFIYEGFAHYDEVTHLYRRLYWTDLCNSDKERWYHTAERYNFLRATAEGETS